VVANRDESVEGSCDPEVVKRAGDLFDFLFGAQQTRTHPVHSLREYRQVLWLHELAGDDADAPSPRDAAADSEAWLVVERAEPADPPEPPALLGPWLDRLDVARFHADRPELKTVIRGERRTRGAYATLDDHPKVRNAYQQWLPQLEGWAVRERDAPTSSPATGGLTRSTSCSPPKLRRTS
jgi:hypothetical protein